MGEHIESLVGKGHSKEGSNWETKKRISKRIQGSNSFDHSLCCKRPIVAIFVVNNFLCNSAVIIWFSFDEVVVLLTVNCTCPYSS